jgi:hypothetical protein
MDEKRYTGTFVDLRLTMALGTLLFFFALCALSAFFAFSFSTFLTFLICTAITACIFVVSAYIKTTVIMTLGKNERVEIYGLLIKREINGKINFWAGLQPTGGFPNLIDLRLDITNPGGKTIILLERIPVGSVPPMLPVSNQRMLVPRDLLSDSSHPGSLWKMVSHLVERERQ